jgi:hypothetical protein
LWRTSDAYRQVEFDIPHGASYVRGNKAGFFMSIESWDTRKIGICFLLLAFVAVAIILPAAGPAAASAPAFALIVSLGIISVFSLIAQQHACAGYHSRIRPRSPPNR